jgi:acetoin utilization protein AcuB
MYISEYMTSDPLTISPDVFLPEARRMLNEYHIRHLPVVDRENRLIGIVSDRDLRSAYPSSVISREEKILAFEQVEKTTVADMMTTSCSTLGPDASLDDALIIFDRDKVGGIPVVSEDNVVLGIFSLLDLTAAYRKLFGVAEEGSVLVGVEDDDRDNILSEIVILFEQNGILLTRLIRLVEKNEVTKIFMRINSQKPVEVYKLLRSRGFIFLEP